MKCLMIGGIVDGVYVNVFDDTRFLHIPKFINKPGVANEIDVRINMMADKYRMESLHVGKKTFNIFVLNKLTMEEAITKLFEYYVTKGE